MDYNCEYVRDILSRYFSGELTREEIAAWGRKADHDFLREGFLSLDKLTAYPFLHDLAAADIPADDKRDIFPPDDEELEYYYKMLCGEINGILSLRMTIPWQRPMLDPYRDVFSRYSELKETVKKIKSDSAEDEELEQYGDMLCGKIGNDTVLDLLELKIISLFKFHIPTETGRGAFDRRTELFPNEKAIHSDEDMNNILSAYIECILGERSFIAEIPFINGKADVNIYPDLP